MGQVPGPRMELEASGGSGRGWWARLGQGDWLGGREAPGEWPWAGVRAGVRASGRAQWSGHGKALSPKASFCFPDTHRAARPPRGGSPRGDARADAGGWRGLGPRHNRGGRCPSSGGLTAGETALGRSGPLLAQPKPSVYFGSHLRPCPCLPSSPCASRGHPRHALFLSTVRPVSPQIDFPPETLETVKQPRRSGVLCVRLPVACGGPPASSAWILAGT